MSVTGITGIAAVQQALKIFYLPGFQYQLATATPLLAEMEHDTESVVGSQINMALRYGRHGGIGNRGDTDILPTPNSRQTLQAVYNTKNIFGHIDISDKVIKASARKEGAFEDLLQTELDDNLSDLRDMVNRELFGDGTGKMGTITSAAWATNQLTLGVTSTQYFAVGQLLDVIQASTDTPYANGSALQVLQVDDDALQIVLSDSVDIHATIVANSDFLVLTGNYNEELTGLAAVLGTKDNTVYGINRAINQWLNPTQIAINGEISENKLQTAVHTIQSKAGGTVDFWVASLGVSRAYGDLLLASRQLVNPGTVKLEGGYEVVTFRGKPFTEDRYAPPQTLYALQRDTWRIYEMDKPEWLDKDGAVLYRSENRPTWQATLAWYADLGCSKPRGNAAITGITEH